MARASDRAAPYHQSHTGGGAWPRFLLFQLLLHVAACPSQVSGADATPSETVTANPEVVVLSLILLRICSALATAVATGQSGKMTANFSQPNDVRHRLVFDKPEDDQLLGARTVGQKACSHAPLWTRRNPIWR